MNDNKKIIRRNRKTVILVSVVSVCLCVSLLIGSALAGFHTYFDSNADQMSSCQYSVDVSVSGAQVTQSGNVTPVIKVINEDEPNNKYVNSYANAYLIQTAPINCIVSTTASPASVDVLTANVTTLTITAKGTTSEDQSKKVQGYAEITVSGYTPPAAGSTVPTLNTIGTYYEQIAPGTTISFYKTFTAETENQQVVITVLPHWGVLTTEQEGKGMSTGGFTSSVLTGTMLQVQEMSYTVVTESCVNGKVATDKTAALPGETVTVTVTPDSGYKADSVYYITDDSVKHVITSEAEIYSFSMPSEPVKVGAQFIAEEPVITGHMVTVSGTVENGSITADKTSASAGEEVTVTAKPNDGYVLESLSYNDGAEHSIDIVTGKFVMPDADVVISGTFTAAPQP